MEIHAQARRIGNSWGVIIPKEAADELKVNEKTMLHVDVRVIPELKELKGTFKTKKSMAQLMKEIDEGWD
jgi:antitoxin component of MazEF toxin-antitoxin module